MCVYVCVCVCEDLEQSCISKVIVVEENQDKVEIALTKCEVEDQSKLQVNSYMKMKASQIQRVLKSGVGDWAWFGMYNIGGIQKVGYKGRIQSWERLGLVGETQGLQHSINSIAILAIGDNPRARR